MHIYPLKINFEERIKHLDGFRGLAIILVFGYHQYCVFNNKYFLSSIFSHGDLGVNLFFLISGFVIFMSLEKSSGFFNFIKKRYLRLFPSMLLISALYYYLFYPINIFDLISGLTFIEPQIILLITGINTKSISVVFWTLFVEFKFYYIVATAYFFLSDKAGVFIGLLYLFYLASKFLNLYFSNYIFVYFYDLGKLLSFAYFSWFATGIYIYKFFNTKKIFYFYLIIIFSFLSSLHPAIQYANIYVFLFCMTIIFLFFISFYKKNITAIFTTKFFLNFGFASYPIYLMHYFLIPPLQNSFEKIFGFNFYFISSFLVFFIICTAGFLISKYYEPTFKKIFY